MVAVVGLFHQGRAVSCACFFYVSACVGVSPKNGLRTITSDLRAWNHVPRIDTSHILDNQRF